MDARLYSQERQEQDYRRCFSAARHFVVQFHRLAGMPEHPKIGSSARRFFLFATILAACFVVVDFIHYQIESYRLEFQSEARKHSERIKHLELCFKDLTVEGCEKEAAQAKKAEILQYFKDQEGRAAEASRQHQIDIMRPICATISLQHANMSINSDWILNNVLWHDAGCSAYFGHVRGNPVEAYAPSNWYALDYSNAFAKRCWVVDSSIGDLVPCHTTMSQ